MFGLVSICTSNTIGYFANIAAMIFITFCHLSMFFVIQPQSIDVISHVNYQFFYVCLPFWQFLAGGDLRQLYFIYHDIGLSPFPEFVV